jgi:membrane associated rhomboid family serine protease
MIPLRDVIPSRTKPGVTITLIVLNVLVFLLQSSLSERGQEAFIYAFGVVPAYFSIVTVFTSMFVHGGLAHIAGNLLFLWIFGDNVEDRLGHFRFVVFYLLCGVLAALAQVMLDPTATIPMVGASGAIAGVMGAYLILYPHSRVLMQFLNGIGQLPVFQQDQISGGVAFWAHVAGFAAGVVLVVLMRKPERQRVEWWDTIES